jgi:uncharacterized repeat protein (TIGR01451 family)
LRFRSAGGDVAFGRVISSASGVDTSNGTIRNLALSSGEDLLEQDNAFEPNGIIYDSVTRKPLAGVQVYLDGPSGFDPASQLLPGQYGQTTLSDGYYRFDIAFSSGAPLGLYSIRFAAPAGYITNLPSMPSTLIQPSPTSGNCAGASYCIKVPSGSASTLVQSQNTAPLSGQTTTYYTRWYFDGSSSSTIVNNHIAVDPILSNALFVTKTASRSDVSRGDLVLYTVTARNNENAAIPDINLIDLVPPGFKYRTGSALMNGARSEPAVSGRKLTWAGLSFALGETKTWQMLLVVGSGVGEGKYTNEAWTINSIANAQVSNTGEATVNVTADPTFDCTDIIGKVFDDENMNGYQDEGERGLPNVKLVTTQGWIVQTDSQGRYHITCADVPDEDRGSNFIMKVDEQTLPSGYRMTTENPRMTRLTRGKMNRLDFGATFFHEVRLDLSARAFEHEKLPPPPPPPAPQWEVVVDSVSIPPVHFQVGKFNIEDKYVDLLREALDRINALPGIRNVRITVTGHTDSSPIIGDLFKKIGDNWALSRSRANQVSAFLQQKMDMPASSFVAAGKADTEPIAANDTPEGRALNRRVEIGITYEHLKKVETAPAAQQQEAQKVSDNGDAYPWQDAVSRSIKELTRHSSLLKISYCTAPGEKIEEARFRLWQVTQELQKQWTASPHMYKLQTEQEIDGETCEGRVK